MEFRVLGPLEVVEQGHPVELRGRRQRALLACLLLHANEVVATERLLDDLWPGGEDSRLVHVSVSRVRKALGAERLLTRPPGYVLRVGPGECDREAFDALATEGRAALRQGRAQEAGDASAPGARAVARAGVRRLRLRAVRAGRGGPPRGSPARVSRGARGGRSGARGARRAHRRARAVRARGAAAGAAARPADAGPVPVGPPGRGARAVPGDAACLVGGARHRAGGGVAGPRGCDPAPGRGARATRSHRPCARSPTKSIPSRLEASRRSRAGGRHRTEWQPGPQDGHARSRRGGPEAARRRRFSTPRFAGGSSRAISTNASQVFSLHGASLERPLGDNLAAIFGIPRLHEDDALRAVQCGARAAGGSGAPERGARAGARSRDRRSHRDRHRRGPRERPGVARGARERGGARKRPAGSRRPPGPEKS